MKFRVRGEAKPEPEVEFWLEQDANRIYLCAKRTDDHDDDMFYIAEITPRGTLLRCNAVDGERLGLQVDRYGRIVCENQQ